MRKILLIVITILGCFGLLFIIGRMTNVIQHYRIAAKSNDPAIREGTIVFSSSLISPKPGDFVVFRHVDEIEAAQNWIFRLCGMPGDTITFRSGDLFVNRKRIDDSLNLRNYYVVPTDVYTAKYDVSSDEELQIYQDSIFISLQTMEDIELIKHGRRVFNEHNPDADSQIYQSFGKEWTAYNFGPYILPADKYFVVGDNREMARDSRFIGPIDRSDLRGTVLFK